MTFGRNIQNTLEQSLYVFETQHTSAHQLVVHDEQSTHRGNREQYFHEQARQCVFDLLVTVSQIKEVLTTLV